jgi:hypothetical protein
MAERKQRLCRVQELIHQKYIPKQSFAGLHDWAPGYCVSTVGSGDSIMRDYFCKPEEYEKKEDQIQCDYHDENLANPCPQSKQASPYYPRCG